MSRSWWLKGFILLLLVGAASLLAAPSIIPLEQQPEFIRRYFHKTIRTEIGLQRGLRLVYDIDLEKALSLRMDSVSQAIEQILRNEHPSSPLKVERHGVTDVLVYAPKLGPELSYRNLMRISDGWLIETERDEPTGTIRLRFDENKTAEVREETIRTAMQAMDNLIDQSSRSYVNLARDGNRIVLEILGMSSRLDADRVKALIRRVTNHPPSLKFAIVANDPGYIRKIAAALPPDSGIEIVTEPPRHR